MRRCSAASGDGGERTRRRARGRAPRARAPPRRARGAPAARPPPPTSATPRPTARAVAWDEPGAHDPHVAEPRPCADDATRSPSPSPTSPSPSPSRTRRRSPRARPRRRARAPSRADEPRADEPARAATRRRSSRRPGRRGRPPRRCRRAGGRRPRRRAARTADAAHASRDPATARAGRRRRGPAGHAAVRPGAGDRRAAAHRQPAAPADRHRRAATRADRHGARQPRRRRARAARPLPGPARRRGHPPYRKLARRQAARGAGCGASSASSRSPSRRRRRAFAVPALPALPRRRAPARVRRHVPPGASADEIGDLLAEPRRRRLGFFFSLRARLAGERAKLRAGTLHAARATCPTATRSTALTTAPEAAPVDRRHAARGPVAPRGRAARPRRPGLRAATSPPRSARPGSTRATTARRARPQRSRASCSRRPTSCAASQATAARLVAASSTPSRTHFAQVDLRRARRRNLSRYDVLIIASMIEREALVPRERRLIAAVIYNRLQRGHPARHRRDDPLRAATLVPPAAQSRARQRLAVQHAHARRPAADADRQPGPGRDAARRRTRRTSTYLYYVVKPCGNGAHASPPPTRSSSATSPPTTAARAQARRQGPVALLITDAARRARSRAPRSRTSSRSRPTAARRSAIVWVGVEGDDIVFASLGPRRKLDNIARDPRVSLSIEGTEYERDGPARVPRRPRHRADRRGRRARAAAAAGAHVPRPGREVPADGRPAARRRRPHHAPSALGGVGPWA